MFLNQIRSVEFSLQKVTIYISLMFWEGNNFTDLHKILFCILPFGHISGFLDGPPEPLDFKEG